MSIIGVHEHIKGYTINILAGSSETMFVIQSTPLVTDTKGPRPLSFIEGVSPIEGFWSR